MFLFYFFLAFTEAVSDLTCSRDVCVSKGFKIYIWKKLNTKKKRIILEIISNEISKPEKVHTDVYSGSE